LKAFMIEVHHLNNSRSHRILWLLEELQLRYEIIGYQRDPVTNAAPASLYKIHPLGKSPVIKDDDLIMAESGAIVEYLVGRHANGSLSPAIGTAEHAQYLYWLHFAEASAMTQLILKLYFSRVPGAPPPLLEHIDGQISTQLDYMESELAKHAYFAGNKFSAADIQMSFPIIAAVARGGLNSSRPNLLKYLAGLQSRPAFKRANERGGELTLGT
jgi:glutathione S-transferase